MQGGDVIHTALHRDKAYSFIHDLMRDEPNAEVFLVGGFVRDALIGRTSKDADFVVRNLEQDTLERWLRAHGHVVFVGRAFGVYKFRPRGFETHQEIDIALPRTEQPSEDSHGGYREFVMHTDAFLPIEDDLARRDLTINAIAYNVKTGLLVDPFAGQQDIEARLVRTVGEPSARFQEDLSRVLRAVRIAAALGYEIEDHTWWAIREFATRINETMIHEGRMTHVVPRETIGSELAKAVLSHPARALQLLKDSGLLSELLPELSRLLDHAEYLSPLAKLEHAPADAAFTLLLRGIPSERIRALLHTSGLDTLSRSHEARIDPEAIIRMVFLLHNGRPDPSTMSSAEFERAFMTQRAHAYLTVLEALGHTEEVRVARIRAAAIRARWWATNDEKIPALVSGDDVVRMGVDPGPAVRLILETLRSDQLDGAVKTRNAALHRLEQLIAETA